MKISEKATKSTHSGTQLKLALIVFVITFIGIGMIIAIYMQLEQKEVKSREEQLVLIARSAARNLENYLGGYQKDFNIIMSSPQFSIGLEEYRKTGSSLSLVEFLSSYNTATGSKVGDIMITDPAGKVLVSTSVNTPYTNCTEMLDIRSSMLVFSSQSGALYLGISAPLDDDYRIMSMVDIEQMYTDTASSMDIGEKGYVMYKHSSGMIIMHPVKEQIGWDVLEDRKKKYPDYDFSDLEGLISRQKQGLSNVEIYNSYWWADEVPRQVKKISAYVPAYMGEDFIIVSTVADFNEIMSPLKLGLLSMGTVLLILGITFTVMVLLLIRSIGQRQGMEKENLYLRDLNSSLEEMHRSEEKLRHFQSLETIGTLTGGIAHELNNLLTPIMAYSAMMMDEVTEDNALYQDVEEIYCASAKAKEVIEQISFISRKDSDVAFVRLHLREELTRALRMVASVKPKNVALQIDIQLPEACHMVGSETQLTQVILNLCTNAFQAMESSGGTLTVTAAIVRDRDGDSNATGDEKAVISFADTGAGIEPRLMARIFDPFFTTKKAGEGTGLGLSIVQSIVESHGGSIDVTSTQG
ncbi:MAG: ATP-binding protein, partial [Angelakisella sp.]